MPHRYREDLLEFSEARLDGIAGVARSQMMGHPGWRLEINNKFFLMVGSEGLILKLPPDRYEDAVARDDVEPFNPMNGPKPMATWIEWIKGDAPEYADEWDDFVLASRDYVSREPPNKKRG